MSSGEVLASLDRLISESPADERPALALALTARLAGLAAQMGIQEGTGQSSEPFDANLGVDEAARRLGVSKHYLYRNARKLPFTVRIGRRVLFSARGIERYNHERMGTIDA